LFGNSRLVCGGSGECSSSARIAPAPFEIAGPRACLFRRRSSTRRNTNISDARRRSPR
jgi:hypothetical protein